MRSLEKKIYLGLFVCLLVSIVGTSFAYFVSSTTIGGTGGKTNMQTADLIGVKFDAGEATIDLQNAVPGDYGEKGFAVTVTPTSKEQSVAYVVKLNITENTFVKCSETNYKAEDPDKNACARDAQELVYTLTDQNDTVIATGDLLEKNGNLELKKESKTVTEATTFNYKLKIEYKNTNADQNHNRNKSFDGSLSVEFAEAD